MDVRKILVASDGSSHAARAAEAACSLAKATGATLVVAHVQREIGSAVVPEELKRFSATEHMQVTERDILRSVAEEILEKGRQQAVDLGVAEVETAHLQGDPARSLTDFASQNRVDLMVLGTRGLGDLGELLLGSVSHRVLRRAPCACVIVP